MSLANVPDPPRWFVLDAEAIDDIDRELRRIGFTDKIGPDRYFDSLQAAREAFRNS